MKGKSIKRSRKGSNNARKDGERSLKGSKRSGKGSERSTNGSEETRNGSDNARNGSDNARDGSDNARNGSDNARNGSVSHRVVPEHLRQAVEPHVCLVALGLPCAAVLRERPATGGVAVSALALVENGRAHRFRGARPAAETQGKADRCEGQ